MKNRNISFSDKNSARAFFSSVRAAIPTDKHKEYSQALCHGIEMLDEYKNSDTVLLYFPTRSEPDLRDVAEHALNGGKKVALPISNTETCTLTFCEVSDLDELSPGAYGISEPSNTAKTAALTQKTLCIVPALALDRDGYRLGYGKGYYDRFLEKFNGITVCAIFSELLCDRLPRLDTDIPVKIIITETGAIRLK